MLPYEADTYWNKEIPCIFFKTIIQFYLLCSFLYSLTFYIKEVIKGKIFWRLNDKSVGLWDNYSLKQGNPLQVFKILIQLYLFCFFSIFDLLYQTGYQRQYFLTLNLKVLACEAAKAWSKGIPCKILKLLIKLFLLCLLVYCST